MKSTAIDNLLQDLERAATSLLTDEEILASLNIDAKTLEQHYDVVSQARLKLKQRLNAKRISDAATGSGRVDHIINEIPRLKNNQKKSTGGARPGAGRKPGTTNKISGVTILASVERASGEKFEDLLAQGYWDSIQQGDKATRLQYEKMFLNKVVADRSQLDVTSDGERLAAPTIVFSAATLPDFDVKP